MKKSILAFSIAMAASVPAIAESDSYFSDMYVFGDSLLDTGNFGVKFTNIDPDTGEFATLSIEELAESLGLSVDALLQGGTNYAVGGFQSLDVFNSVAGTGIDIATLPGTPSYLAASGGKADSKALYFLDGGGNDINAIAGAAAAEGEVAGMAAAGSEEAVTVYTEAYTAALEEGSDMVAADQAGQVAVGAYAAEVGAAAGQALAAQMLVASAGNMVKAVAALDAAGANYIAIANTPMLGNTPAGQAAGLTMDASVPATLDSLTANLNMFVAGGLQSLDANVIPIDLASALEWIHSNAGELGLAHGVLSPALPVDQFYMCYDGSGGDCVEHPSYGKNGTNPNPNMLAFNDGLHPTGVTSDIIGDYMTAVFDAPKVAGLLPTEGIETQRNQLIDFADEITATRWASERENKMFYNVRYSNLDSGGSDSTDFTALSLGAVYAIDENLSLGLSGAVENTDRTLESASIDADSYTVSGSVSYTKANAFIDVVAATTWTNYGDVDRNVNMGGVELEANGSTSGVTFGADVLIGYRLEIGNRFGISPSFGYTAIQGNVDGYREGEEFYQYAYADQSRNSAVMRAGILFDFKLMEGLTFYGDVYTAEETKDGWDHVDVMNNGQFATSYSLPSYLAEGDEYMLGSVALSGEVGDLEIEGQVRYDEREEGQFDFMLTIKHSF